MSRYHTPQEKAAAVARVLEGGERPAAVARSLGIDESTLRGWRKAAGGPRAPKTRPAPAVPAPAPGPAPERTIDVEATVKVEAGPEAPGDAAPSGAAPPGAIPDAASEDSSERLRRALGAAGIKGEATGNGKAADPEPEPVKIPTPEQLVMLLEVVLFLTVRGACAGKSRDVTAAQLADLSRFRVDEREMLELLAPYACPYVPLLLKALEVGAAIAFVGVFGMSVAARIKEIDALPKRNPPSNAPPRAPEPKPEPEPAPSSFP